jgi:hypothetical protein
LLLLALGSAKAAVAVRFEEEALPGMPSASARASSWALEKAMREDK